MPSAFCAERAASILPSPSRTTTKSPALLRGRRGSKSEGALATSPSHGVSAPPLFSTRPKTGGVASELPSDHSIAHGSGFVYALPNTGIRG